LDELGLEFRFHNSLIPCMSRKLTCWVIVKVTYPQKNRMISL